MKYLQVYFQEVNQVYQGQNATEHSYRPALKKLMESLDSGIQAINEPKRIACGAPDFVVKNGVLDVGHIEAKDIGVSLKKAEKTAQMGRYFQALGNLILTDYLEFRWYVEGELKLSASLGTIDKNKKIKVDQEGMQEVDQLLQQFLLAKVPQITTPKDLAKRMASLAQLMRDAIKTALDDVDKGGTLREQLESFQRVLIKDLTVEQFADMYAQTICYGLFAARCNIVKSVDYILKHKFNISKGLADSKKIKVPNPKGEGTIETHQVLILDPAVGTGTFIHNVIDFIYDKFKNQRGMWSSYVSQHLLPRLFGFELLMAPYTVAHIKLVLQLQELGYDFSSEERLRIYLTNTLQEAFQIPPADGFMNRIRNEAEAAKDVKQDVPVMVILGNPPYSYESINTDPWIVGLVRDYYQVDGKPLGERNPKGLLDDYVKFIRFAQHRVSETGYGIVALITNHGYLDNPTFRGMRQNLMQTFDEIYVLDLHGNSKKKEVCPDGSQDKNVFDIQQGVAISIFIKYEHSQQKLATVYHADLWGMREVYENKELVGGKYHWLAENDISSTDWKVLQPQTEFYLFSPQNTDLLPEYEREWKITEIMLVNSTGIKTHRDQLVLDFDFDSLKKRLQDFRDLSISDFDFQSSHGIYNKLDWDLNKKRKIISNDKQWKIYFKKCLYRPFDTRHYYHNQELVDRPRQDVMQHIINCDNLGLIATRQITSLTFSHILCTEYMIEMKTCSHDRGTNIFPLYLYPTNTPTLFDSTPTNAPGERKPNLSPEFITQFSQKLDLEFISDGKGDKTKTFGPEDIFNYIYAIFHAPIYRQRYAEFLKIDFPRVPLTANAALFWELVIKGDKLVKYHLMKETGTEISTYPIPGSDLVEQVKYHENHQQIWINAEQYFDQVPQQIWNFYIGGYQVCQKWLKDRKGRQLNFDDISHYQNIISIISETIKIMEHIDQIIDKYGGFPLE